MGRPRWAHLKVLTYFIVGLFLGATATASALWTLSGVTAPIPTSLRYAILGTLTLATLVRETRLVNFSLPKLGSQVPRTIFRHGTPNASLRFGIELGLGYRTIVTSALPYLLAAALLLSDATYTGAFVAGCGFATARGIIPVARLIARNRPAWDDLLTGSIASASMAILGVGVSFLALAAFTT